MEGLELANERIEEIMQNETPLRKKEGYVYSTAVKSFFSKIRALRSRGFSFIQICGAFEKTGLLPEESNPYSFRQAFIREFVRRDRTNTLLQELKNTITDESLENKPAQVKATIQDVDNSNSGIKDKEPASSSLTNLEKKGSEAIVTPNHMEKDQEVKEMTCYEIKTGTGYITKHSDGSFDY